MSKTVKERPLDFCKAFYNIPESSWVRRLETLRSPSVQVNHVSLEPIIRASVVAKL